MQFNFLTDFEIGLVVNFAVFVATLVFGQKIKDFFNGIPSDMRKGLTAIEGAAVAQVKTAQAQVVASLTPAPAPVVKPAVPDVPVVPAAPAA